MNLAELRYVLKNVRLTLSSFSLKLDKKYSNFFFFRPNSTINQSEFLAITWNLLKARENLRVQGAIGFGSASRWLKNWRKTFKPTTKSSKRNCAFLSTVIWELLWFNFELTSTRPGVARGNEWAFSPTGPSPVWWRGVVAFSRSSSSPSPSASNRTGAPAIPGTPISIHCSINQQKFQCMILTVISVVIRPNGTRALTSAMPVQRSISWAIRPTLVATT